MLDFFRAQRPLNRFVILPMLALFPLYLAGVLSGPIIAAHGPGAFRLTLVTMAVAAVLAVLVVRRFLDTHPATLTLGFFVLSVTQIILLVVSWDRLALICVGLTHGAVFTFEALRYQKAKAKAAEQVAASLKLAQFEAEEFGACRDSACWCAPLRVSVPAADTAA